MEKCELTHARHDQLLCLTPGLFRSVKKGEKGSQQLDVSHKLREKSQIRIFGRELLGVDDMRVLQGLVGLAGLHGQTLGFKPESHLGVRLRKQLRVRGVAEMASALSMTTSYLNLGREIGYEGYDGGRLIRQLRQSVRRLAKIYLAVTTEAGTSSFRMLSAVEGDTISKLTFALNPQLSASILGGEIQYARIDLVEARRLKTDQAKLLHQRLSAWVDVGRAAKVEFRTLEAYVWGSADSTGSTLRMRRSGIRRALVELIGVGWSVVEYAKGKYEVRRALVATKKQKIIRTNADVQPDYH